MFQFNMLQFNVRFQTAGGSMVHSYQRVKHPLGPPLFADKYGRHSASAQNHPWSRSPVCSRPLFFQERTAAVGKAFKAWFGYPGSARSRVKSQICSSDWILPKPGIPLNGYHSWSPKTAPGQTVSAPQVHLFNPAPDQSSLRRERLSEGNVLGQNLDAVLRIAALMYSAVGDHSPYIYLKYLWPGNEASDRRSVPVTKTHDRSRERDPSLTARSVLSIVCSYQGREQARVCLSCGETIVITYTRADW